MPTPKAGYYLKDGSKIPSVTTIIGRWKDSGALMQWAFKQGKEGKARLYEEAEKAADIGTCVHAMVEMDVKNEPAEIVHKLLDMLPSNEDKEKALSSFSAYKKWRETSNIKILHQEIMLVSEKYRYGGTPDAIGLDGNSLVLIDYKSSKGVYADYLIQLAAYKNLWEENHEGDKINGFHLLRFSKEKGDLEHRQFSELDDAWEQFLLFRRAYDIDKELKKRV